MGFGTSWLGACSALLIDSECKVRRGMHLRLSELRARVLGRLCPKVPKVIRSEPSRYEAREGCRDGLTVAEAVAIFSNYLAESLAMSGGLALKNN